MQYRIKNFDNLSKLEQVKIILKENNIPAKLYCNYSMDAEYDEIIFYKKPMIFSIGLDPFGGSNKMFLAAIGKPSTSNRNKFKKGEIVYNYNYKEICFSGEISAIEIVDLINEYDRNLYVYYDPTPTEIYGDDADADDDATGSNNGENGDDVEGIKDG